MAGIFLFLALVAALAAAGTRVLRRRRRRRALAALAGGSPATALEIDAFSEIEDHLLRRQCPCGGLLANLGERSEPAPRGDAHGRRNDDARILRKADAHGRRKDDDARILRVVRVECRRCEERMEVWFDATRAYH